MLKVPTGTPVVNALFKQRACIENVLRCVSLCLSVSLSLLLITHTRTVHC
jgi:hypothetical protein